MCSRTANNINQVLTYLDSLEDYHKSIGACYPSNLFYKAQCLENVGRFKEACKVYASYSQVNDSVRSAELDDKLSKFPALGISLGEKLLYMLGLSKTTRVRRL